MATSHRTEAQPVGIAVIENATVTVDAMAAVTVIATAIADIETAVEVVAATHPAILERTPPAARRVVTRVGVEAGVVIPADTHVVIGVEMETTTEEAATAPAPAPLTDPTALAEMTVAIARTATTAVEMMIVAPAPAAVTAPHVTPLRLR